MKCSGLNKAPSFLTEALITGGISNVKNVEIFTDGSCSRNPGPGNWRAILHYNQVDKELSGFEEHTTSSRLELIAAIEALKALSRRCNVILYTNAEFLQKGLTEYFEKWRRNGWKKSGGGKIKNVDLWVELHELCQGHNVECRLKGHAWHLEKEALLSAGQRGNFNNRDGYRDRVPVIKNAI